MAEEEKTEEAERRVCESEVGKNCVASVDKILGRMSEMNGRMCESAIRLEKEQEYNCDLKNKIEEIRGIIRGYDGEQGAWRAETEEMKKRKIRNKQKMGELECRITRLEEESEEVESEGEETGETRSECNDLIVLCEGEGSKQRAIQEKERKHRGIISGQDGLQEEKRGEGRPIEKNRCIFSSEMKDRKNTCWNTSKIRTFFHTNI